MGSTVTALWSADLTTRNPRTSVNADAALGCAIVTLPRVQDLLPMADAIVGSEMTR